MFQKSKMDDDQVGQVSDLSDWDEPASQPDLSTNDSTFVPPAEEESDEEEEVTGQRRSKRKKIEKWCTRREVGNGATAVGGWAEQVEGSEDEGAEGEREDGDEEEELEDEEVVEGGDNGATNAELSKQDQTALAELNYDDEDVEDFLRRAQNANTRSQTELVVEKYHRVMSAVAKMERKEFKPLDETDRKDLPRLRLGFLS